MIDECAIVRPRVIVGLGNPGSRYAGTRHNAGFQVIDRILARCEPAVRLVRQGESEVGRGNIAGREVIFAKPQTFMNASGPAVASVLATCGAGLDELLVVHDCLDLPVGRIRLRPAGGSGGQRGVESVIEALESQAFARLRIGIGRVDEVDAVEYVLSGWSAAEQPLIEKTIEVAAEAALFAVDAGIAAAMNRYNGWRAPGEPPQDPKPRGEIDREDL